MRYNLGKTFFAVVVRFKLRARLIWNYDLSHVIWIGPPSSSPWTICVGLPHPRSRRLFAAATRAAGGASAECMMLARVANAPSVWPRAKDRISVGVLAIYIV
jgi:hypothetical protein